MATEKSTVRRRRAVQSTDQLRLGPLKNLVGFSLHRAHNKITRKFHSRLRRGGLHPGDFSSLVLIDENPGVSQGALAAELGVDKAMMVILLDRVEKKGLIRREQSSTDRRFNHLFCTEAGRDEIKKLQPKFLSHESMLGEVLSDGELKTLLSLLHKIAAMKDQH